MDATVQATIADYPAAAKFRFETIRAIILDEAKRRHVGPLDETLKWGEPAYLTSKSKSGSTIRMAWKSANPDSCNLYFNCKTDIVDRFKSDFPDVFRTTKNRCVHIPLTGEFDQVPLRALLGMALTYHKRT